MFFPLRCGSSALALLAWRCSCAAALLAIAGCISLGPTITERRSRSSVTVQGGETVALGGLIQDTNSRTKNALPFASDIPVIGAAFGTTDHNVQRTELLLLLSPEIVHNAADARAATEELRSRLHSLQGSDTRLSVVARILQRFLSSTGIRVCGDFLFLLSGLARERRKAPGITLLRRVSGGTIVCAYDYPADGWSVIG